MVSQRRNGYAIGAMSQTLTIFPAWNGDHIEDWPSSTTLSEIYTKKNLE